MEAAAETGCLYVAERGRGVIRRFFRRREQFFRQQRERGHGRDADADRKQPDRHDEFRHTERQDDHNGNGK